MHADYMPPMSTRKLRPAFKLKLKGSHLVRGLLCNTSPTRKLRPGPHMEIVKEKGQEVQRAVQAFKQSQMKEELAAVPDENEN